MQSEKRKKFLDDFMDEGVGARGIFFSQRVISVKCSEWLDFAALAGELRTLLRELDNRITVEQLLTDKILYYCLYEKADSYSGYRPKCFYGLDGVNTDTLEYVFNSMDYKTFNCCEIDVNNVQNVRMIFYK
jgi:hypothetical protein